MLLHKSIDGLVAVMLAASLTGCGSRALREAPAQADPAVAVVPDDALHRYAAALDYVRDGDDLAAERALAALHERYPDYAGPLVNLGIIHNRNERSEEAIAVLSEAVVACTNCASAYNELGIAQRRSGNFAAAEQAYRAAIDADPAYALAHYNLGVLYDLYRSRPQLALTHYERYQQLDATGEVTEQVDLWIADLRARLDKVERTAQTGGTP